MATKKSTIERNGKTKADLVDVVYDRHGGLTKDEVTPASRSSLPRARE